MPWVRPGQQVPPKPVLSPNGSKMGTAPGQGHKKAGD